jgi:hypothetical protein
MLGNPPYYNKTTETIVQLFGYIFSDISIQRVNPNTNAIQTIKVPIEWSAKEKWDLRERQDPNAGTTSQFPVDIILPRMGYELRDYRFDPSRMTNILNSTVASSGVGSKVSKQLSPIPIIWNFSLYLQTRTYEDAWQVIEQMMPFFRPDLSLAIIPSSTPPMNISTNITFTMTGTKHSDNYDADIPSQRLLEHEWDFDVRGYLYSPIKNNVAIINMADIGIIQGLGVGTIDTIPPISDQVTDTPQAFNFTEIVSVVPGSANVNENISTNIETFEDNENVDLKSILENE